MSDAYSRSIFKGLRPQKVLSVSDWSDKNRVLTRVSSSEAGRWRTDRTPYLRKVMDCLSALSTYQLVVFMKGSQVGAPLALDTLVPTPDGLRYIKNITPGDLVFGSDGLPLKVIAKSAVFKKQKAYRVTFDCGASVDCDYRHLWTFERSNLKGRFDEVTISTDVLFETYKKQNRNIYRLKNIDRVESKHQNLPIDPYTLGVWLGDGHHTQNRICANEHDAIEISHHIPYKTSISDPDRSVRYILIDPKELDRCPRGHVFNVSGKNSHGRCAECHRIRARKDILPDRVETFGEKIRRLDLYGNKHIPERYLTGSLEQRLSLLQGLMDTDGYCSKKSLCEFTSTNKNLSDGVFFLAASLGLKPKRKEKPPGSKGVKPIYAVQFTAYRDDAVFRLKRKAARLKKTGRKHETGYRRVVKVERIDPIDTVCIKVDSDSPDNLFAVTDSHILTHNTEAGNNWIGYTIDHDPSPMLVIQPIDKLIKRFVKQRITPLIEGTPSIAQKFGDNKKDQSNTLEYKAFPGGALAIAGANSAPALRSMPAEKIFADEVDAYPKDVGGEGDPLSLAAARQRTFSKKKTFAVSTPVEENSSKIEELFKETCQQYFYVPCPQCNHEQHLVWEQMRWEDDRPDTARYECIACGYKIANWQKTEMLDAGEWIPHEPDKLSSKKIGFHLNALYSPVGWLSWEEIVSLYLEALASADENKMKVFLNTILGETYKTKAEVPDHHRLWEQSRASQYKANQVPHDVLFLTAGVDIQKDRIELEIVGWCRDKVSYSIDYRVLIGDTSQPEVYRELDMLLTETFAYVDDPGRGELKIAKMAIDTGYETQTVYNWARKHRGSRVMAIKGSEKQQVMVGQPKPVDIKNKGTYIKRGLRLWSIGVNIIKEELYSWLRQDMPKDGEQPPVGYCHFLPYGEEFFKQLTAERLIFKKVKGFEKTEWQKFRERNEALDCRVYNRAAASAFGIDRFRDQDWQRLEVATSWKPKENTKPVDKPITETKQPETKTQTPEPRPAKKAKKVKVKRSSYLHG